ncbi:DUF309 domain-containing protein [Lutimaribacter marinistellae]|uniref:DUF309 domain-containing protein n=1 Tax=Lutimaribacter marinistellae TaxID=1820329 RepID=A0ABV7TGK9_9RHOB
MFDAIRDTAVSGMTEAELSESDAWLCGWEFFRAGFFWEAHELWEPVWMALPPNSAERSLARAAIQLANAELKVLMGRPAAALRLCDIADECLSRPLRVETLMGLPPQSLSDRIKALRGRISQDMQYKA